MEPFDGMTIQSFVFRIQLKFSVPKSKVEDSKNRIDVFSLHSTLGRFVVIAHSLPSSKVSVFLLENGKETAFAVPFHLQCDLFRHVQVLVL
jgi:hypothetical protein